MGLRESTIIQVLDYGFDITIRCNRAGWLIVSLKSIQEIPPAIFSPHLQYAKEVLSV